MATSSIPPVDGSAESTTTPDQATVAPTNEKPTPAKTAAVNAPKVAADTADQNGSRQAEATATAGAEQTAPSSANTTGKDKVTEKEDDINPIDFEGTVDSNDHLPSVATLNKIGDYIVLDRHGKTHTFKSLYSGSHVARRVLVIFVRHFFCGNCQEYLRTLSASITPEALLRLPISTFIAVVGCGDPKLIDMYQEATGCPFPMYTDPTRKLYEELGMVSTLKLGPAPAYMKKSLLRSSFESVIQGLKQIPTGLALKAGDQRQIGGEFLFEPASVHSPVASPISEEKAKDLGHAHAVAHAEGASLEPGGAREEKRVSWCHRMRNTRDHAEIPELMEVLGLDGHGQPIDDQKRWSKALEQRKGTGLSMAREINVMKEDDKKAVKRAKKADRDKADGAASTDATPL